MILPYWLKVLVEKLSDKPTTRTPLEAKYRNENKYPPVVPAYSQENIANQKHKFMDSNERQRLTKKAWTHADKE